MYWQSLAKIKFEWKRVKSNDAIIHSMHTRCRECGAKNAVKVTTSKFNSILVCMDCTNLPGCYSRLLCRQEILELNRGWSIPKIQKYLPIARKRGGYSTKFFYWENAC